MTIFEDLSIIFNCLDQYWRSALGCPGNPGVVGFYRTFMETIHSMCDYRHPVWAVGHAGHCAPPDSMDMVEGKFHFPFIIRVDSSKERFITIKIVNKLQLPLIVSWYIHLLYTVGVFTGWKCNLTHTHKVGSNGLQTWLCPNNANFN